MYYTGERKAMSTDRIAEMKARIPMSDVVGKFVALERIGSYWKGLCPFHPDKNTPSLTVYSDHAFCFGCKNHWDIFSFLQTHQHKTFPEAIDWLTSNLSSLPSIEGIKSQYRSVDPTIPIPYKI